MAMIKRWPQDDLRDRKQRRLEELAQMAVDSALPPTDRLPQDRTVPPSTGGKIRDSRAKKDSIGTDQEPAEWLNAQFSCRQVEARS